MKHLLQRIKSVFLVAMMVISSLPLSTMTARADGATYKLESVGVGGAVSDSGGGSHNAVIMNMSNEATGETVANAYCIELNVGTNIGQGGYRLADWATSGIPNLGKVTWILTNSYPQKTVAELKAALVNAGFESHNISEKDAASMTQSAIWHFTNGFNPKISSLSNARKALYNYLISNAEDMPEPMINLPTITVPAVNYLDYLPFGPISVTSVNGSDVKLNVAGSEVVLKYADDNTIVDLNAVKSGRPFFATPTNPTDPGSITFSSSASVTVPAGKVFKHPTLAVQTIIAATAFVKTETVSQVMSWQKIDRTAVKFEKTWVGGPKADKVIVRLLANGVEIAHKAISEVDTWKGSFDDLPVKDASGTDIVYTIVEDGIANYIPNIAAGQIANSWIITNTYASPKIPILATKNWVGGKYFDGGVRPTVYFELWRRNGTAGVGEKVVDATKLVGSTIDFGEQDKTDNNGADYEYFVKEVNADGTAFAHDNYIVSENGLAVTNKFTVPKTDITATKKWVNGPAPVAIEFQLYRKIAGSGEEKVGSPITLQPGELEHTWVDMPATDNDGNVYIYSVKEVTVLPNFNASHGQTELDVINTYSVPKDRVTAKKVWVNGPATHPDVWFKLYRRIEGGVLEAIPGASIHKVPNSNKTTWSDIEQTDINGNQYIFSIKEVDASGNDFTPENYTKKEEGLIVTNTYNSPKIDITGTKIWEKGPADKPEIQVQLYKNGISEGGPITLKSGTISYTWTGLDKTDGEGNNYVYRIDEVEVPENYVKTIVDELTIKNTYESPLIDVTATKKWLGDKAPVAIDLQLYRQIKGEAAEKVGLEVVLLPGNTSYTWKNLPRTNEDGVVYEYSVKEVTVLPNYEVSYNGLEITNTYRAPRVPDTGFGQNISLWLLASISSLLIGLGLFIRRLAKQED